MTKPLINDRFINPHNLIRIEENQIEVYRVTRINTSVIMVVTLVPIYDHLGITKRFMITLNIELIRMMVARIPWRLLAVSVFPSVLLIKRMGTNRARILKGKMDSWNSEPYKSKII